MVTTLFFCFGSNESFSFMPKVTATIQPTIYPSSLSLDTTNLKKIDETSEVPKMKSSLLTYVITQVHHYS
jgi:hypothetical protein